MVRRAIGIFLEVVGSALLELGGMVAGPRPAAAHRCAVRAGEELEHDPGPGAWSVERSPLAEQMVEDGARPEPRAPEEPERQPLRGSAAWRAARAR